MNPRKIKRLQDRRDNLTAELESLAMNDRTC